MSLLLRMRVCTRIHDDDFIQISRARKSRDFSSELLFLGDNFLGEITPRDHLCRSAFLRARKRVFNATDTIRMPCTHACKRGYTGTARVERMRDRTNERTKRDRG